jgi:predicted double-glycine peptidase
LITYHWQSLTDHRFQITDHRSHSSHLIIINHQSSIINHRLMFHPDCPASIRTDSVVLTTPGNEQRCFLVSDFAHWWERWNGSFRPTIKEVNKFFPTSAPGWNRSSRSVRQTSSIHPKESHPIWTTWTSAKNENRKPAPIV